MQNFSTILSNYEITPLKQITVEVPDYCLPVSVLLKRPLQGPAGFPSCLIKSAVAICKRFTNYD